MGIRQRFYTSLLKHHLASYRQMAFVAGPRQVGKTTTCRQEGQVYLDWDNEDHREIILRGAVADFAGLERASLARAVRVSENTIRKWVATLAAMHFGFLVPPWHKNVTRALRKEPKWFLRDWSGVLPTTAP